MGQEIVIEVGDSFKGKHDQFKQLLGDQYTVRMRELVEDELHTLTKQIERQTEHEQAQIGDEIADAVDEE